MNPEKPSHESAPLRCSGDGRAMFSIQRGYSGRESSAIVYSANWLGRGVCWEKTASAGTIPIGSVEYCAPLFGPHRLDFYPDFLKHRLCRCVDRTRGPWPITYSTFAKDATAWKSTIESGVLSAGEMLPPGEWLISPVVDFVQEWRYYVADGDIITTGWYYGHDEDEPAPKLDVAWPKGFSGAVDFGRLADGRIALVECHAPLACGWYGDDHTDYAFWQAVAWEHRAWWSLWSPPNVSGHPLRIKDHEDKE